MSSDSPGTVSLPNAPDLRTGFPRSPRDLLAGYVIAARALDKCRAELAGTAGEYHFNCSLDREFFNFTRIDADEFRAKAATGATDGEMAEWITAKSRVKERAEIVEWNNRLRGMRPCDLPLRLQLFLEDYIPKSLPPGRVVNFWFDLYDIEEKRM